MILPQLSPADSLSPRYWEELLQESQSGGSLSYFMGEQYQRGAGTEDNKSLVEMICYFRIWKHI